MKSWKVLSAVCAMAVAGTLVMPAAAQDKAKDAMKEKGKEASDAAKGMAKEGQKAGAGAADQMMPMPAETTPGEHHARLAKMAGRWNVATKMWPAPGAPPMESKGTAELKMIMDGRFLQEDFKSDMMGMPFSGMNIIGYDGFKKQYVSTWIDSMTTETVVSRGTCSDDGKVTTLEGMMTNPETKKAEKTRIVTTKVSDDQFTMEMFGPGPDGKDVKMMELQYTRAK